MHRTLSTGMNRRTFLAAAAAAGAALPPPPAWTKTTPTTGAIRMNTRKFGQMTVSELGAGCMSISANSGPPADRTHARWA